MTLMLREVALKRISLSLSIAGIALLFFLGTLFEAKEITIAEASDLGEGAKVAISAKVYSAFSKGSNVMFELDDGTGKLQGIAFNAGEAERKLLRKNNFVKVIGRLQLYKNNWEIIAEKVGE